MSRHVIGQPIGFGLTGCRMSALTQLFGYIMFPGLFDETLLCLTMLYKAWETYRTGHKSELLDIIIKDRCVTLVYSLKKYAYCSTTVTSFFYFAAYVCKILPSYSQTQFACHPSTFTVLLTNSILFKLLRFQNYSDVLLLCVFN